MSSLPIESCFGLLVPWPLFCLHNEPYLWSVYFVIDTSLRYEVQHPLVLQSDPHHACITWLNRINTATAKVEGLNSSSQTSGSDHGGYTANFQSKFATFFAAPRSFKNNLCLVLSVCPENTRLSFLFSCIRPQCLIILSDDLLYFKYIYL